MPSNMIKDSELITLEHTRNKRIYAGGIKIHNISGQSNGRTTKLQRFSILCTISILQLKNLLLDNRSTSSSFYCSKLYEPGWWMKDNSFRATSVLLTDLKLCIPLG